MIEFMMSDLDIYGTYIFPLKIVQTVLHYDSYELVLFSESKTYSTVWL